MMQNKKCNHIRVRKQSRICIKCAQKIDDNKLDECYSYNAQLNIFEKISLASKIITKFEQEVVQNNKRILFLDIDDTMLHCDYGIKEYDCINGEQLIKSFENFTQYLQLLQQQSFISFSLQRSDSQGIRADSMYYFQIRPGFLQFILENYEKLIILITTTGVYDYAKQICRIIDPHNLLFERITAREGQSNGAEQGIVVADQSSILQQSYNNIDRNIKTIDVLKQSQILLDNYIIFDDSSFPWYNKCPPEQFFRSIPFSTSRKTTNNDSFAQSFLPITQERTFIAPFIDFSLFLQDQLLSFSQFLNQKLKISYFQSQIFQNCTFYFQRQSPSKFKEIETIENGKLKLLQYVIDDNLQIDLRVLTVWQFGGTVVADFTDEVTHYVLNTQQYVKIHQNINNTWIESQTDVLHFNDANPTINKQLISSNFIFISCFLLKRQKSSFISEDIAKTLFIQ